VVIIGIWFQIEEEERHREVGTPEGPELVTRARYEALVRRLETMNALSESARLQREECVKLRKTNDKLQERVRLLLEEAATLQVETRRFEEKAGALQVKNYFLKTIYLNKI
jgi:nucleoprotein TPR